MRRIERIVLLAAVGLFGCWLAGNYARLTADQEGFIRFVLGLLFAVIILFRSPPTMEEQDGRAERSRWAAPLAVGGAVLALAGILLNVHQFEWLGLIAILGGCLWWSLPRQQARNILPALFLLYWVHPLPGQVFGGLQLMMQRLSIKGAEFALQSLNVRIWADDLVLQTGFKAFGVPESCSGMRTGITVLLCTLGVSLIFRFRWHETAALIAIGFLQVLAFNIARITGMAIWAPRMPEAWAENFLHDTLGIFLLICIGVTQAEASWWKVVRERWLTRTEAIRRGDQEKPDRATMLPPFWRRILKWWLIATAVILAVLTVSLAIYKRRPTHRAAMIAGTVDPLLDNNPEAAQRAIRAALRFTPGDRDLLSKHATALVLRGRYEEALAQISRLPGDATLSETIMRSWALMALGRADEAVALLDALPENSRTWPGVAIVRAEYAAQQHDVEMCARYVADASRSVRTIDRVRALFPFLGLREQWRAIADCNSDVPFNELSQAILAIHANLKMNNVTEAARLLHYVLQKWPRNPVYLSSLFTMAMRRSGGQWEDVFAENLTANLDQLDTDTVAYYVNYCFQLNRADLAWVAYLRLKRADPQDPTLDLAPARYAPEWLTFRRRQFSLGARDAEQKTDLRALRVLTGDIEPFRSFWRAVPLAEEMTNTTWEKTRSAFFNRCLAELEKREKAGALSLRMEMMYPTVLATAGRYAEAHARLSAAAIKYPDMRESIQMQQAALYNQQAEWQNAYEALLAYPDPSSPGAAPDALRQGLPPGMGASLLLINAMMNMNLGICAMDVAQEAKRLFPSAPELMAATAAIWDVFGYREEALFELGRTGTDSNLRALPQLLYETGRLGEAKRLSQAFGVAIVPDPRRQKDYHFAPPAELVLQKRFPPALSDVQMDAEAARAAQAEAKCTSPFLRSLSGAERQWFASHGSREASLPETWAALGRDRREEVAALHRLTLLLARQGRYDEALRALELAVEKMPGSAMLRRMNIAMTDGQRSVVEKARKACPTDSEVWLADLVSRCRAGETGGWAIAEMRAATTVPVFPVETMVRAGHFLLSSNYVEAASLAAQDAMPRADGYLPAYVLALKCAARQADWSLALEATTRGVENAIDRTPFFKALVEIKSASKSRDAELVRALENLIEHDKDDPQWAERLGQVYFENRDLRRALTVLMPVIAEDLKSVRVQSLLIAAEAARCEGNGTRALDILETAYALYPQKMTILNNLVYYLAQNPTTVKRARSLLPSLLAMGGDSFVVYDTASVVYLQSGQLDRARTYMEKAQKLIDKTNYAAPEVNLNAARVLARAGDYKEALRKAEDVRRTPNLPVLVDMNARKLMDEIRSAQTK